MTFSAVIYKDLLTSIPLLVAAGGPLISYLGILEQKLARMVALASTLAMIFDWISGYYGFGSLIALLIAIWLMRR